MNKAMNIMALPSETSMVYSTSFCEGNKNMNNRKRKDRKN